MSVPPYSAEARLFEELIELRPEQREERLASVRRSLPDAAARVERLLDAEARAGDFLGLLRHREAPDHSPPDASSGHASSAALHPGLAVGPFRLVRELGRGGMAVVWLAHDPRLDRAVALKFLGADGHRAHREAAAERFLIEARAAAALDHPHVATIYEVGRGPEGRPYIAMAYCEGGSLADRLANEPLAVETVVRIAAQVASALEAAHARSILHRDVKPANILFDAAQRSRLADFGIARFAGQVVTSPGIVLGTVAYLSPEQLQGQLGDARSDLWALGVTMYEMLSGRRPFEGESPAATMHAILFAPPSPLERHRPDVPRELLAIVSSLLARSPSQRPASAADVARALEQIAQELRSPSRVSVPHRTAADALGPWAATPLVGREGELASALGLLGHTRLLTLTGPGGIGKTRLALELTRRASAWFSAPAVIVRLAGIVGADRVPEAIAHSVGLRDAVSVTDAAALARHLDDGARLLVLDNFEHVLGAAPFVAELLELTPSLTLVVTSREPLRLRAEQELPVPPLGLPAGDDQAGADASDAVRLFVQRARAGRPDFALTAENASDVAQLCRRLDGLPLAIELAAARTRFFSPRALLARLDRRLDLLRSDVRDADPRHRALRDVMAWSHDLLSPEEQTLFAELGVFAGSVTLDAVAAVATSHLSSHATAHVPDDVIERVASLCDKSLLTRRDAPDGEPRLAMLETVREFARERLAESRGAVATRRRHARWFANAADVIGDETGSPARARALVRVQSDLDDVLAALQWSIGAEGDAVDALRIVGGLTMFWHWSGLWREGRRWAARALDAADRAAEHRGEAADAARPATEQDALGRTLQAAHLLSWTLGEPEVALAYAERAIRIWATLEAAPHEAAIRLRAAHWATYTHSVVAFSHLALGKTDVAVRSTDAGVAAAHRAGGPWIIGFSLGWRAMLHTTLGHRDLATADLSAAQRALSSIGDAWTLSWCYTQAAAAALSAGDPLAAARNAVTGVAMLRAAPDWHSVARGLEVMAASGVAWREFQESDALRARIARDAAVLLGAAMASRHRGGATGWRSDRDDAEATERQLRRVLGDTALSTAWDRGHALTGEALLQLAASHAAHASGWPTLALVGEH